MSKLNHHRLITLAIYSLAFLWIFTGLTSIFFQPEVGYKILASAGITGVLADFSIYTGGALDIALGIWLLSRRKIKLCCIIQVLVITTYTILLSIIDAGFWLHPFGPVTKNFPIIILIIFLYQTSSKEL